MQLFATSFSKLFICLLLCILGCQDARRIDPTAQEVNKVDGRSSTSAASLDQQHTKSRAIIDSVEPAFLVEQPTADHPVTAAMVAAVASDDATSVDIWIKLLVSSGYHIYASNEGKTPFSSLQIDLQLPSDVEVNSEWTLPPAQNLSGKLVYFDSVVMHRRLRIATEPKQSIEAIIHYQACNDDVCFPPAQIRIVESLTCPP